MSQKFIAGPSPNIAFSNDKIGRMKKEVFYMTPEQVDKELEEFGFPAPPELCKAGSYIQTTPGKEQDEIRRKNDVVLIPIGCTEDHGPMNPSGMDTFMVTAIAEGVRRYTLKHGPQVSIAFPPLLYGVHPQSHVGMDGTVVLHEETAIGMLKDVMLGLWNSGYRKMILINNHGHLPVLQTAVWKFMKEYQLPGIYRIVDWHRAVREMFALKEDGGEFETMFTHACEAETGCGLLCFPDMVNMDYVEDGAGASVLPGGHFDGSVDDTHPSRWEDGEGHNVMAFVATPNGVAGKATAATADKLKKPYLAIMKYLVLLIDEYLEAFPPGTVPDPEKTTLRTKEELAPYLKEPHTEGWKSVYGLSKTLL